MNAATRKPAPNTSNDRQTRVSSRNTAAMIPSSPRINRTAMTTDAADGRVQAANGGQLHALFARGRKPITAIASVCTAKNSASFRFGYRIRLPAVYIAPVPAGARCAPL
jgi:hypothetical protein